MIWLQSLSYDQNQAAHNCFLKAQHVATPLFKWHENVVHVHCIGIKCFGSDEHLELYPVTQSIVFVVFETHWETAPLSLPWIQICVNSYTVISSVSQLLFRNFHTESKQWNLCNRPIYWYVNTYQWAYCVQTSREFTPWFDANLFGVVYPDVQTRQLRSDRKWIRVGNKIFNDRRENA